MQKLSRLAKHCLPKPQSCCLSLRLIRNVNSRSSHWPPNLHRNLLLNVVRFESYPLTREASKGLQKSRPLLPQTFVEGELKGRRSSKPVKSLMIPSLDVNGRDDFLKPPGVSVVIVIPGSLTYAQHQICGKLNLPYENNSELLDLFIFVIY